MISVKSPIQTTNRYSSFLDIVSDDDDVKYIVPKAAPKNNKKKFKKNGKLSAKKSEVTHEQRNVVDLEQTGDNSNVIENAIPDADCVFNVETMTRAINITKLVDCKQNIQNVEELPPSSPSSSGDDQKSVDNTVSWFDMCEEEDFSQEEDENESVSTDITIAVLQQPPAQQQSANIAKRNTVDMHDVSIETASNEQSQWSHDNCDEDDDCDKTVSAHKQEWAWQPTLHFRNRQRNAMRQQQKQQQHETSFKRNNLAEMQNYGRNGIEWQNRKQQCPQQRQRRYSTEVDQKQHPSQHIRHNNRNMAHGQLHQPASIASRQNHHHQHQLSATQSMKNRQRYGDNSTTKASIKRHSLLPPSHQQHHQMVQRFGNGTNNGGNNGSRTNSRLGTNTNSWRAKEEAHETDVVSQSSPSLALSSSVIDNNWRNYRAAVKNL